MRTGIVFDLDGTLLDTLGDLTDATNYALAQFGCPPRSVEELRTFIGNGALRQITLSLPGKAEDPDPQAVLKVYKAYYENHCRVKTKPYDGILEILAELGEKYPVAIVSNKPDPAVKTLCAHYFPGICALGEIAGLPRKPAPDMVYRAMADIGVERCVYVGDSEVDVLTAKNAGAVCLSVLWGFRDREVLQEAGARWLCEKPEDIPGMIEKMIGENNGQ